MREARKYFLYAQRQKHRFWRQEFLLFNEMHLSACRDTFVALFSSNYKNITMSEMKVMMNGFVDLEILCN